MAKAKINLAVLISGRGSNLQSIIDACGDEKFPAQISLVISNIPDVYGLERAQNAKIKTVCVNHKDYKGREAFEQALLSEISKHDIDLVCLAGFMRILTPTFISGIENGRLINIHPSLLPDYKGLNTHQRAIDDKRSEAGCSIHHVVPDVDAGKIILQKSVSILENDDADSLAQRILKQEHIAYPEAIEALAKTILHD